MIDVIVPTHNRPAWLAECLASIRRAASHVGPSVGIIVVDDASDTHAAQHVCETYSARYIRHEANTGVGQALADGWAASDAPWTAFFGDDDVMLPNWFVRHLELADGADVVSSSYYMTDAALNYGERRVLPPVTLADLRANIVSANDGSLLRRSALPPWHPENGRAMMLGMWLALAQAGARFATIAEPCWLYRRHDGNLSGRRGTPDPEFLALRRRVIEAAA